MAFPATNGVLNSNDSILVQYQLFMALRRECGNFRVLREVEKSGHH
jgi:hypothetical protein